MLDGVSAILKPGSSLHPTFLKIVDGAFAFLLLVLLSLLFVTRSYHFFFLSLIELGLWASVKWVIYELQSTPAPASGDDSNTQTTAVTQEKKDS